MASKPSSQVPDALSPQDSHPPVFPGAKVLLLCRRRPWGQEGDCWMPLHSDEISLQLSLGGWLPSMHHHTLHLRCSRAFLHPHPSGMLLQLPPRPLQALTGSGCRRALPQFFPASSDGHFMSTCSRLQEFKEKDTREGTGGIGAGRARRQRVMTVKCVCV